MKMYKNKVRKIVVIFILLAILSLLLFFIRDDIKREVAAWTYGESRQIINSNYKNISDFCLIDSDCVVAYDPSGCTDSRITNREHYRAIMNPMPGGGSCFSIHPLMTPFCENFTCAGKIIN